MSAKPYLYTVYKTTNLINSKIYIGVHKTTNPNDRYFGSGTAIKQALKKYGKHNFKKDVLHIFETRQEMIDKEIEIVTKDFIRQKTNYNQSTGGMCGKIYTDEVRKMMSDNRKGVKKSEEHKKKIGEGNSKRVIVNSVIYPSIKDASIKYNITETCARKKIITPVENGWNFVETPVKKRPRHVRKGSSKSVSVEGIVYSSQVEAARSIGVTTSCMQGRMVSKHWKDYFYV